MDTKQAIYTMLLSKGYIYGTVGLPVMGGWGSGIQNDYDLAAEFGKKCQSDLAIINWDNMREPSSENYSKWQGTFADDKYVDVMYGQILLHDGSTYSVGYEIETYDFASLLGDILQYDYDSLVKAIDRMAGMGEDPWL